MIETDSAQLVYISLCCVNTLFVFAHVRLPQSRRGATIIHQWSRTVLLTNYLVAAAGAGVAVADAVSAARAASEFHVSRMIIHFPSLRCNTVRNFPVSMVAPDLSVLV